MLYGVKNPHGGDRYGDGIALDFSANVSPLGTPKCVTEAIERGLPELYRYPDPYCRALVQAIARYEGVPGEFILCGNGASELIYAYCEAVRPGRAMELALVENLQREDLNPMEEAAGYKKLMDDYNLTQEQVASRVQKSRPAVTNALRLLSLGETLQKKVSSGKLSAGHARALLPLKTETLREKAAAEVESRGLSVRQTETLVASLLRQAEQTEKEEKKPPVVDYVREAEKALSDALGRGVKFQGGQKKGRIALEFYSADDREALMEALRHMDKPWKKK